MNKQETFTRKWEDGVGAVIMYISCVGLVALGHPVWAAGFFGIGTAKLMAFTLGWGRRP